MTDQPSVTAQHAIRAAKLHKTCGRWAAQRYAEKRGVPPALVRLARQLEACQNHAM